MTRLWQNSDSTVRTCPHRKWLRAEASHTSPHLSTAISIRRRKTLYSGCSKKKKIELNVYRSHHSLRCDPSRRWLGKATVSQEICRRQGEHSYSSFNIHNFFSNTRLLNKKYFGALIYLFLWHPVTSAWTSTLQLPMGGFPNVLRIFTQHFYNIAESASDGLKFSAPNSAKGVCW